MENYVSEDSGLGSANEQSVGVKKAKKSKKRLKSVPLQTFDEKYEVLTGQRLGSGSYAKVETCRNRQDETFAVKVIDKTSPGLYLRSRVFKEIDTLHLCSGHENVIQLIEYFEEPDKFLLVFEKIEGGQLLDHLRQRTCFTEYESSRIMSDLGRYKLLLLKLSKSFTLFLRTLSRADNIKSCTTYLLL